MTEQERSEIQAEYKKETGNPVINTQGEFDIDYVDWLEQKLQASQHKDKIPRTEEDLGDELCNYCPREKKGVYGVPGGFVAGCEGSNCNNAYDAYLEELQEGNKTSQKMPTTEEMRDKYTDLREKHGLYEAFNYFHKWLKSQIKP